MNAKTINTAKNQGLLPYSLAAQQISLDVYREKYAKNGEQVPDDTCARVAAALAKAELTDVEGWTARFLDALKSGFIPAGRISSAAGTDIKATLANCFVQGIGDAMSEYDDGKPGICLALAQAAETMRRGGGVGYVMSTCFLFRNWS